MIKFTKVKKANWNYLNRWQGPCDLCMKPVAKMEYNLDIYDGNELIEDSIIRTFCSKLCASMYILANSDLTDSDKTPYYDISNTPNILRVG